jgi:hypothetical protein
MKVFVPLTDEMLDQLEVNDRLVPYQAGLSLLSQCSACELEPRLNSNEAPARPRLSHPTLQPCPN